MAKAKGDIVIIGSKLPHGLVLNHPLEAHIKVTIRGLNSAPKGTNDQPMIVPYMTTEVDSDFWDAWKLVHNHSTKPFRPLASGAIFECSSVESVEKVYREREKEKTGLEPLSRTEAGVKPADKD